MVVLTLCCGQVLLSVMAPTLPVHVGDSAAPAPPTLRSLYVFARIGSELSTWPAVPNDARVTSHDAMIKARYSKRVLFASISESVLLRLDDRERVIAKRYDAEMQSCVLWLLVNHVTLRNEWDVDVNAIVDEGSDDGAASDRMRIEAACRHLGTTVGLQRVLGLAEQRGCLSSSSGCGGRKLTPSIYGLGIAEWRIDRDSDGKTHILIVHNNYFSLVVMTIVGWLGFMVGAH